MDRNTFTGLFLIMIVLAGSFYFFKPSEAEIKKEQEKIAADSAKTTDTTLFDSVKNDNFDNGGLALSINGIVGKVYNNTLGYDMSVSIVATSMDSVNALQASPFCIQSGQTSPVIPINAFRPRAYECIYNYWYRNKDLTPLEENSRRVVNRYLTTAQMASGADTFAYDFHNALLEKDSYTSCLPMSMINYAPLVGVRRKEDNVRLNFSVDGNPEFIDLVCHGPKQSEAGSTANMVLLGPNETGRFKSLF